MKERSGRWLLDTLWQIAKDELAVRILHGKDEIACNETLEWLLKPCKDAETFDEQLRAHDTGYAHMMRVLSMLPMSPAVPD